MEKKNVTNLVIKAQSGNSDALNELLTQCYDTLFYYAYNTVKNEDLAADITQESCMEIINTLEKLRNPEAFMTWAWRIVSHQCVRYYRQTRDEVSLEEDEEGNTILDQLPDEHRGSLPEQVQEDKEFQKVLWQMLDSLPPEQRQALLLYYYENLSVSEIAQIQDKSVGTVKSRLNYGRKAVIAQVEAYEKKTGVRLHSIALLPLLLLWLFQTNRKSVAVPVGETFRAAGRAASGAAKGAAAAKGAVAVKIVAGVAVAALVIGGAVFGISKLTGGETESSRKETTSKSQKESISREEEAFRGEESKPQLSPEELYAELTPSQGLRIEVRDGYCVLVGTGSCTDTEIVVPAEYEGLPVTTLGPQVFAKYNRFGEDPYIDLKKISLPPTLTRIENRAFWGCDSLTEVAIYASAVLVEDYTFWECTALEKIDLSKLNMTGTFVFADCNAMERFTISGITGRIGRGLVYECVGLRELTIPESVKEIPQDMCYGCENLTDIYYGGTIAQWNSIEQNVSMGPAIGTTHMWWEGTGDFTVHCSDGDIPKTDAIR